ncbi:MAG: hypothetical protein ACLQAR_14875 [Steroidobacteraceae bacterium]
MKAVSALACLLVACDAPAADCVPNLRGKTVCSNGQSAAAVNPSTGTVTTAQKSPNGVTTVQNSNGTKAAYNPHTGNGATGPNGTTCAKGVNNQGCKK